MLDPPHSLHTLLRCLWGQMPDPRQQRFLRRLCSHLPEGIPAESPSQNAASLPADTGWANGPRSSCSRKEVRAAQPSLQDLCKFGVFPYCFCSCMCTLVPFVHTGLSTEIEPGGTRTLTDHVPGAPAASLWQARRVRAAACKHHVQFRVCVCICWFCVKSSALPRLLSPAD